MSTTMRTWQSLLFTARNLHFAAAFAICVLYLGNLHFNPDLSRKNDLYFGADCDRVLENLKDSNDRWTHYRDRLHPFFSIVAVTVAKVPAAVGISGKEFVFYRLFFGTFGALLFFALLYRETSPLQSFASLAMLLSTLSFRLFSTLPESFLFGFFTIMLALYLARAGANPIAVLIASMASATTNIALGVIHTWRSLTSFKQAVQIAVGFLTIAVLLAVIQRNMYPTSDYFFNVLAVKDETRYMTRALGALPFRAFDFLFSGFAMPLDASLTPPIDSPGEWRAFLAHGYWSKRATLAVALSIAGVAVLYLTSAFVFFANKRRGELSTLLCGFFVFEFVFHMIYGESAYGDSPFLFSLHFVPVIILFFSLHRLKKFEAVYPPLFIGMALLFQYVNLYNFDAIFR